jgi:hypothetical protein
MGSRSKARDGAQRSCENSAMNSRPRDSGFDAQTVRSFMDGRLGIAGPTLEAEAVQFPNNSGRIGRVLKEADGGDALSSCGDAGIGVL